MPGRLVSSGFASFPASTPVRMKPLGSVATPEPVSHFVFGAAPISRNRCAIARLASLPALSAAIGSESDHFQELAECIVLNAGTKPVVVSSVKIVDDTGQTRSSETCSGSLGAGEFCQIVAHIDFNNSFACIVTAPATTTLRASIVLDEFAFDAFFVKNVRPMTSAPLE